MALTVETGAVVAGADSYVSVADCTAYHAARGNTTWADTTKDKEALLRKATSFLDNQYVTQWKGLRTANNQPLQWPRQWVMQYDADARSGYAGTPVYVESNVIPQLLKDAVCECALRFISKDMAPDLDAGGKLASLTVGPITKSWQPGTVQKTEYPHIDMLLKTLLKRRGSARVVRS